MADKQWRIDEQIRARSVRLIGVDGKQLGIVPTNEAISQAKEASLSLVEIDPNQDPPVCQIMDHGKRVFEQKKRLSSAKKKQKKVQIKEVKFTTRTEKGDYDVKLKNISKFLVQGNKVKVSIRFRGREMAYQNLGLELMEGIRADLEEEAVVEFMPKVEGRQMTMVLAPKK